MRYGIVGAGGIAQAYAQAFAQCSEADLVGVADTRLDAAQKLAETNNSAAFSSHEEMISATEPEAVVVCTPPVTHADICTDLMQRGIHVLCEKPLAMNSDQARQMIDAAALADVKFTMASKFRYADDVIAARKIVESGILGDMMLFENVFSGRVDMSNRWNSNPEVSGGGVLIDNGTHSVDIMRYFLGPVVELQVVEGRRVQNLPVEDTVRVFVKTEAGVMGSIDLSWSMQKEQPYYISIYGSQGTVLVGWQESKYKTIGNNEWIVFGQGYNKIQSFQNQIENFTRAIRGEEILRISPQDGLASVEVIEAAYESLQNENWIPVSGDSLTAV